MGQDGLINKAQNGSLNAADLLKQRHSRYKTKLMCNHSNLYVRGHVQRRQHTNLFIVDNRVLSVITNNPWKLDHKIQKIWLLFLSFIDDLNFTKCQSVQPVNLWYMTITMSLAKLNNQQQIIKITLSERQLLASKKSITNVFKETHRPISTNPQYWSQDQPVLSTHLSCSSQRLIYNY
jgi:hypothetical protein